MFNMSVDKNLQEIYEKAKAEGISESIKTLSKLHEDISDKHESEGVKLSINTLRKLEHKVKTNNWQEIYVVNCYGGGRICSFTFSTYEGADRFLRKMYRIPDEMNLNEYEGAKFKIIQETNKGELGRFESEKEVCSTNNFFIAPESDDEAY